MSKRNITSFLLIIISLGCLYPGLVKPILSMNVGSELPLVGYVNLHASTQSVMTSIKTLHKNNNTLVAFLILFFSIIVPVAKAVLLLMVLFFKKMKLRETLYNFVYVIGKWSMADVYVVGVFLSFLATRSNDAVHAELQEGFYYFLAYCIISLLAIQVMKIEERVEDDLV